jgi:hypothetical protein
MISRVEYGETFAAFPTRGARQKSRLPVRGVRLHHLRRGLLAYYYSQLGDPHEHGNFVRWSSYGPEYGLIWSF